ncbi:MAG: hypothetical protein EB127_05945 [Alphaproteobacteria bacterium]|nr:hypothetical protein [Alphaproteobacteria bacterium]
MKEPINEKDLIKSLAQACKSFAFILPEPTQDPKMCKTTTELYRVQYKLAKQVWADTLKDLNKYEKQ